MRCVSHKWGTQENIVIGFSNKAIYYNEPLSSLMNPRFSRLKHEASRRNCIVKNLFQSCAGDAVLTQMRHSVDEHHRLGNWLQQSLFWNCKKC